MDATEYQSRAARAERAEQWFVAPTTIAALLAIPAVVVPLIWTDPSVKTAGLWLDWAIWGVFVLEVLVLLPLAPAVPLVTCLKVIPAIVLAMFVPVTPAGIGQRELAFQLILGMIGVSPTASLAASLVYGALGLCLAGIGGLCLIGEQIAQVRAPPT